MKGRAAVLAIWLGLACLMDAAAAGEAAGETANGAAYPWSAVGQVNIGGYRQRRECTGVLVAPDLVLTAAHCLYAENTRVPAQPHDIHFVQGAHRGAMLAHASAACFHALPGYSETAELKADAAAIVLARPLAGQPVPLLEGDVTPGMVLVQAGYPQARRRVLTVRSDCVLRSSGRYSLLVECAASRGSSGGPLLLERGGQFGIAGIVVASAKPGFIIAIRASELRQLTEKRRCP